jgi:hypothetical protein
VAIEPIGQQYFQRLSIRLLIGKSSVVTPCGGPSGANIIDADAGANP